MQFVIVCIKYLLTGIVREFCEHLLHAHKYLSNYMCMSPYSVLGASLTEMIFFLGFPDFLNQYLTMSSITVLDILILFC